MEWTIARRDWEIPFHFRRLDPYLHVIGKILLVVFHFLRALLTCYTLYDALEDGYLNVQIILFVPLSTISQMWFQIPLLLQWMRCRGLFAFICR